MGDIDQCHLLLRRISRSIDGGHRESVCAPIRIVALSFTPNADGIGLDYNVIGRVPIRDIVVRLRTRSAVEDDLRIRIALVDGENANVLGPERNVFMIGRPQADGCRFGYKNRWRYILSDINHCRGPAQPAVFVNDRHLDCVQTGCEAVR